MGGGGCKFVGKGNPWNPRTLIPHEQRWWIHSRILFQSQLYIIPVSCFPSVSPEDFYYTSHGMAPEIDGVDDAEDMLSAREALSMLGNYTNWKGPSSMTVNIELHQIFILVHLLEYSVFQQLKFWWCIWIFILFISSICLKRCQVMFKICRNHKF